MIIVTGGAGFIGSNIVYGLNQRGRSDVLVVDDLTDGHKHLNLNRLRFADYLDKDALFAALPSFGGIDAIIHQGACSDTTERDGRFMMANNYEYSKRLLDHAEQRGIPFLYASSAAVYGAGNAGFREVPACESPLNVYGFSKLAFDNFVRARIQRSRSRIVGLRYFNVYGPQERHKGRMASVALHLYDQLKAGGTMQLFEGSDQFVRDFVSVDDVVAVNLALLDSDVRGIFNCGSGQARSFTDIAKGMAALHGSGELRYVPFPDDLKGKYQRFTEADLSELRAAGYSREFLSLEAGLAAYHGDLRQHGGFRP